MKRLHRMYIVMGALCLILVCASLAMAANYEGSEEDFPTATTAALPVATTGGHARLVALIGPGGTVVRAYGVKAVTHPATGIYCIKPSGTWKVAQVAPAVTVEWGYSSGSALLAYYFAEAEDCPAGNIEVLTYNFGSGAPDAEDTVAFTIVVP
ncbi:MAG: hypothetical protein ACLQHW_05285 [bacterium]